MHCILPVPLYLLNFLTSSVWAFYVPLFGTLVTLGFLYWKRHSHPLNFGLLSLFTILEAFTLGVTLAFFDNVIVLQALYAHYLTLVPAVLRC